MISPNPISRRSVLLGSSALLAVSAAGLQTVRATTAKRQLIVTSPGSPDFQQKLATLYPALVGDKTFGLLSPASLLIENQSSRSIRALSITWVIETKTGQHQVTNSYAFTPKFGKSGSPKSAVTGDRTRFTGSVKLLKRNGVRLFSPFFSWSPGYVTAEKPANWSKVLSRKSAYSFLQAELTNATKVTATLEAVIFADHTIVGQDTHRLAAQFAIRRNAQSDAGKYVQSLLSSGLSTSRIAAELVKQANGIAQDEKGNAIDRSNPDQFDYYRERSRHAKVLLLRLMSDGPDKLAETAAFLSRQKKTVIVPAA